MADIATALWDRLTAATVEFLTKSQWAATSNSAYSLGAGAFGFTSNLDLPVVDQPDFTANEFYGTGSRVDSRSSN